MLDTLFQCPATLLTFMGVPCSLQVRPNAICREYVHRFLLVTSSQSSVLSHVVHGVVKGSFHCGWNGIRTCPGPRLHRIGVDLSHGKDTQTPQTLSFAKAISVLSHISYGMLNFLSVACIQILYDLVIQVVTLHETRGTALPPSSGHCLMIEVKESKSVCYVQGNS